MSACRMVPCKVAWGLLLSARAAAGPLCNLSAVPVKACLILPLQSPHWLLQQQYST